MRYRKEIMMVTIICFFLVLALGSINNDEPVTDREPAREEGEDEAEVVDDISEEVGDQEDLELLEHGFQEDGFLSYVAGKIRNNSNKDYGYVQVQINLYDAEGTLVDSTLDNVNNLRAGETWAFEAIIISPEKVDSYRIEAITGF
jgi:hypothetical protein